MTHSSLFSKALSLGIITGSMIAGALQAHAVTVNWTTDIPGMPLFQSGGSNLDSTFKFELGTLDSGPTGLTVSTVDDNWNPIEQEAANDFAIRPNGNVFAQYASDLNANGSNWDSTHITPTASFAEGSDMFVLVHNGTFDIAADMWTVEPTQWAVLQGPTTPVGDCGPWELPLSPDTHVGNNVTMCLEEGTIAIGNLTAVPEPSVACCFHWQSVDWR
ncbi:MAG: hypothetical protein ACI9R3_003010 [Verrucomicrobiales bacterium]|jgi:hypothetical protein